MRVEGESGVRGLIFGCSWAEEEVGRGWWLAGGGVGAGGDSLFAGREARDEGEGVRTWEEERQPIWRKARKPREDSHEASRKARTWGRKRWGGSVRWRREVSREGRGEVDAQR